jgi:hypothetical protein
MQYTVNFLLGRQGKGALLIVQQSQEFLSKDLIIESIQPNRSIYIIASLLSCSGWPQISQSTDEQTTLSGTKWFPLGLKYGWAS